MRLEPSYIDLNEAKRAIAFTEDSQGSSALVIGLCVGGVLFCLLVGLILLLIQRGKSRNSLERHTTLLVKRMPEKPLTLKKPTPAVKAHTGVAVAGGVVLKKSPSPTGSKSPPGSSSNYASPVDQEKAITSAGKKRKDSSDSAVSHNSLGSTKVSPDCDASAADSSILHKIFSASEPRAKEGEVRSLTSSSDSPCVRAKEAVGDQGCNSPVRRMMSEDLTDELTEDPKLGKLHFRLKYNYEKHALSVTIEKATELAVKDGSNHCDPYVKLHLLPEKQHKVKTRVLMKTRNPVYDEEFTFFGIEPSQLQTASLNFVVLSFDRFSRDKIIGEVLLELAHLEFDTLEKQISLVRDICPRDLKIKKEGRGELLVSICYQPAANRLTVVVLKARNLPKMDFAGLCDPYVKIYLLADGQRVAKKKTHIKKRTLNPVFNESFIFDLPYQEGGLDKISLEFLLLDYERVTKNEVIGKLVLDMNAGGLATRHWKEICEKPRRQIAEWHKLRYCE